MPAINSAPRSCPTPTDPDALPGRGRLDHDEPSSSTTLRTKDYLPLAPRPHPAREGTLDECHGTARIAA